MILRGYMELLRKLKNSWLKEIKMAEIKISVEPTPNPNALKFICNLPVKTEGKSTFREPHLCQDIDLARELFDLRGVDQLHFFENVISLTKFTFEPWDSLEPKVQETIKKYLPDHNPDFKDGSKPKVNRENLSPELQQIEEILDRRIRPGLQGDGGDLTCEGFENNVLMIRYQGACGTCPSSTMGTLEAIRGILQDEYDPDIEVYIAPENQNS